MNVDYDLLTWEGDILRLKFWAQAFDVLKAKRRRVPADRRAAGRLLGDADPGGPETQAQSPRPKSQGDQARRAEPEADDEDAEEREKVIVRSNGVVTYVGKDIAYQFWKLGLLGRDFHYRVFADRPHGRCGRPASTGRRDRPSAVRRRGLRLQRHRRPAVVSAEAAEAGARRRRPSRGRRAVASLLVRDGGAVARDRARAGLRAAAGLRGREAAVRRGVGPQGPRRQGRRPARHADRASAGGEVATRNAGAGRRPTRERIGADDRASRRCATS